MIGLRQPPPWASPDAARAAPAMQPRPATRRAPAATRRAPPVVGPGVTLLLSAILFATAAVTPAWAGAWMQGPGRSYTKLSVIHKTAGDRIDVDGNAEPIDSDGRFEDTGLWVYVEHGLTRHVDLVATGSFKRVSFTDDAGADGVTAGLGDVYLMGRFGALAVGPLRLSALTGIKAPLGYNERDEPPLGAGQVDLDLKLLVSSSLYPWPAYLTGEIGYRWRNGFASEIPYAVEAGVDLGRGTWVRVTIDGIDSRGQGTADPDLPLELTSREEDFTKVAPGFALPLEDWLALEVTYGLIVAGKNTIEGRELSIGFSFRN